MTPRIGSAAAAKVVDRITGGTGMSSRVAALSGAAPDSLQVHLQNVSADLVERAGTVKYPALHIYCEKVVNDLGEKFRSFSGKLHMAIEVRHSQDRLEGIHEALELYADAATQVLNATRGDWGDGMFYAGGYEISFGAVKSGGRNLIQVAKITFEIGVSRS